ncbi:hypothetical protein Paes_1229 [Prosthecochloris aestuarii DSM 271]|uniref:Uncharacterized protein n=2 Tax=Prosthecochloris aestuarii TaxID=1102 RepID=B4S868_PROA2|nr:hypothetical protein Paes_1229 [Prosthecochloris aestuarii DSM 271]
MKKTIIASLVAVAAMGFTGTAMAANGSYFGSSVAAGNYTDDPNGLMAIDSPLTFGNASASCCGASTNVIGATGISANAIGAGSMDYSVSQLGVAETAPTSVTISNSSSASGSYTGDLTGSALAGAGNVQFANNGNGSTGFGGSASVVSQSY